MFLKSFLFFIASYHGSCMKPLQLHYSLHYVYFICVSAGESAVPELHRSPLLLSATPHLLLGRTSLSHDAAGETSTVFYLEVWTHISNNRSVSPPEQAKVHFLSATWPVVSLPLLMNSRQPESIYRRPVSVRTDMVLCCAASSIAQKQFPDSN